MAGKYASLFVISRFQAELDRLFQEALQIGEGQTTAGAWQPPVDIVETATSIAVLIEVPGVAAADLQVEVKGTLVTLTGTKSAPLSGQGGDSAGAGRLKFQCVERGHGRFRREIQLFWPVNSHQGTARLADGLLTLEFPKIQEKRHSARLLQIQEDEKSENDRDE
jgi:HSP20 family protein